MSRSNVTIIKSIFKSVALLRSELWSVSMYHTARYRHSVPLPQVSSCPHGELPIGIQSVKTEICIMIIKCALIVRNSRGPYNRMLDCNSNQQYGNKIIANYRWSDCARSWNGCKVAYKRNRHWKWIVSRSVKCQTLLSLQSPAKHFRVVVNNYLTNSLGNLWSRQFTRLHFASFPSKQTHCLRLGFVYIHCRLWHLHFHSINTHQYDQTGLCQCRIIYILLANSLLALLKCKQCLVRYGTCCLLGAPNFLPVRPSEIAWPPPKGLPLHRAWWRTCG